MVIWEYPGGVNVLRRLVSCDCRVVVGRISVAFKEQSFSCFCIFIFIINLANQETP